MRIQRKSVALPPPGRTPSALKTQSSATRLARNSARTRPPNSRFPRISTRTAIRDADKAEGKACVLTTSLPQSVIIEVQYAAYRFSSRDISRIDVALGYVSGVPPRSEEHTSELQSQSNLVC